MPMHSACHNHHYINTACLSYLYLTHSKAILWLEDIIKISKRKRVGWALHACQVMILITSLTIQHIISSHPLVHTWTNYVHYLLFALNTVHQHFTNLLDEHQVHVEFWLINSLIIHDIHWPIHLPLCTLCAHQSIYK